MQVVKLKQKYTFTPFGDRRHKEKCSEKINVWNAEIYYPPYLFEENI